MKFPAHSWFLLEDMKLLIIGSTTNYIKIYTHVKKIIQSHIISENCICSVKWNLIFHGSFFFILYKKIIQLITIYYSKETQQFLMPGDSWWCLSSSMLRFYFSLFIHETLENLITYYKHSSMYNKAQLRLFVHSFFRVTHKKTFLVYSEQQKHCIRKLI